MPELSANGRSVTFTAQVRYDAKMARFVVNAAKGSGVKAPGIFWAVKPGTKSEGTLRELMTEWGAVTDTPAEDDATAAASVRARLAALSDDEILALRDRLDADEH